LTYSLEEKSDFVRAILANSVFNDHEYYGLITEVLMQIPAEALEKIDSSLDHIVIMRKSTYAAAENVLFTCVEKHETRLEKNIVMRDKRENQPKPFEVVMPVHFQKYVIIFGLDNMKKLTQAQKLAIIAGEFAHVYLKHDFNGDLEKEDEAARLIESWGFHPFLRPNAAQGQRRTSALVQAQDFEGQPRT
jgi:hypothetical protein